jgi:hypothetical protein
MRHKHEQARPPYRPHGYGGPGGPEPLYQYHGLGACQLVKLQPLATRAEISASEVLAADLVLPDQV